jgi:hypothetical protein
MHSHSPGVNFYKDIWHAENITPTTQDENINISHSTINHQTCKAKNVTWYLVYDPGTTIFQNQNSMRKYGILNILFL